MSDTNLKPIPPITPIIEIEFWKLVDKTSTCWIWKGERHQRDGYGRFRFRCNCCRSLYYRLAHRVAYFIAVGKDPCMEKYRKFLCHTCDNTMCVNPSHLFLGTKKENNQDRHRKGRTHITNKRARGRRNARSKLNPKQVREIRLLKEFGEGYRHIGKLYGINPSTVAGIVARRWWKHVK